MKEKANALQPGKSLRRVVPKLEISKLARGLLYCACAYFFGSAQLLFQTAPLGLAFMCAAREYVPFAALGAALGALTSSLTGGQPAVIQLAGIVVSFGFRCALQYVQRRGKFSLLRFNDSVGARIASCLAGGVTISLIRIIYGGFVYYDLLAAAAYMLLCCGAVYVFPMCLDGENRYTGKYEAGVAAFMFASVIALRDVTLLGMSAGALSAFFLTLFAARRGGALRGVVVGFLCGAALDLSLCPMFGIIGFICGVLSPLTAYIGVVCSLIVGLCCGLYISGFETLTSYLPEAAVAGIVFLPLEYLRVLPGIRLFSSDVSSGVSADIAAPATRAELTALKLRVRETQDMCDSLSVLLDSVARREKTPAADELSALCAGEFSHFCKSCVKRRECFPSAGKPAAADFSRIGKAMYERRTAETGDLPERIKTCPQAETVTTKINVAYARLLRLRAQQNKTGVISEDCANASRLLCGCLESCGRDWQPDEELTRELKRKTRYANLFGGSVTVCGSPHRRTVIAAGVDAGRIRACASEIKRNFESVLETELTEPEISDSGGFTVLEFHSRTRYSCEFHSASRARDGELINGDTAFSASGDGIFCGAVFDGMGSGRYASVSSKLAGIIAQKLTGCGCGAETSLKILNHITSQRAGECFTTVDMLCFDRVTGDASFYKCGAAPSLVLRGGRVFRIASHTPPVGIMPKLCAEKIDFELKCGDFAVLLSDGITEACAEPDWLYTLLSDYEGAGARELAELIVQTSSERFGGGDDMTAAVVRIGCADSN